MAISGMHLINDVVGQVNTAAKDTKTSNVQSVPSSRAADDMEDRDDECDRMCGDFFLEMTDLTETSSFDVEVIEEHSIVASTSRESVSELELSKERGVASEEGERCSTQHLSNNLICPKSYTSKFQNHCTLPIESPNNNLMERSNSTDGNNNLANKNSMIRNIIEDFSSRGDKKILRAIGRTATVNAAVLVTAATGGAAGAVGYATGGAIAAKRLSEGIAQNDEKEVTKSLAVYGCATGASIAGQAVTGAVMIGLAGASLPLAGAVAFGVGCCSGITAGALSEWTVDSVMEKVGGMRRKQRSDFMERCGSEGALSSRSCESSREVEELNMTRSESCQF